MENARRSNRIEDRRQRRAQVNQPVNQQEVARGLVPARGRGRGRGRHNLVHDRGSQSIVGSSSDRTYNRSRQTPPTVETELEDEEGYEYEEEEEHNESEEEEYHGE